MTSQVNFSWLLQACRWSQKGLDGVKTMKPVGPLPEQQTLQASFQSKTMLTATSEKRTNVKTHFTADFPQASIK